MLVIVNKEPYKSLSLVNRTNSVKTQLRQERTEKCNFSNGLDSNNNYKCCYGTKFISELSTLLTEETHKYYIKKP